MKKNRGIFLLFIVFLSLALSGCNFISNIINASSTNTTTSKGDANEKITSFEILTDDKMKVCESDGTSYNKLVLKIGEGYQIKTNIDDKLGDDYYLKYVLDVDDKDKVSISNEGYIEVNDSVTKYESLVIEVELYKKEHSTDTIKRVSTEYFVLIITLEDYAKISLSQLEFDSSISTYFLTIDSGESYEISPFVEHSGSYIITYQLTEDVYSDFMNVNENGVITTLKTTEDRLGKISIKAIGENGVLDEVFLMVKVLKSSEYENGFKVVNSRDGSSIYDSSILKSYINDEIYIRGYYNDEKVTVSVTVEDPNVLKLDSATNNIKCINCGSSLVTIKYESYEMNITVNVVEDKVISLYAPNNADSFIIVNNELRYLKYLMVEYESGKETYIPDLSIFDIEISDIDDTYKKLLISYQDLKLELCVKYYEVEEYQEDKISSDIDDFSDNMLYGGINYLPNEGEVRLLVIPVWFRDSNVFFNEQQKTQIVEDIEYTMNGNRNYNEFYRVSEYYNLQSHDKILMNITVSDFYTSDTSYQDYSDNIVEKSKNTDTLAKNAIDWYFETNQDESISDYDKNNDGRLDGVILYYAANYYGSESDNNNSYAYARCKYNESDSNFNTLAFCPVGCLYGLQKKEPTEQLTINDLSSHYEKSYKTSPRVVIHEIGHMFGNEDLYEKSTGGDKYIPAGGYVMQDNNIGSHDPYHTNMLGWSVPDIYSASDYEVGDKITIELANFQLTGQNIILTNDWNSSSSLFDEYLIIELFSTNMLNEYDYIYTYFNNVNSGIRLWHVNSLLVDYSDSGKNTSQIISGHQYELLSSNYDVQNKYDTIHLIRNNPNEEYNSKTGIPFENVLFEDGDSFDMETYKSQFINGNKLDNGNKLGWSFKVEKIYKDTDGIFGAIITLERIDNTQTEFSQSVMLNRSDLETPDGLEDYSSEIFGDDSNLKITYNYVTPPSYYTQEYPISSNGMCLFAKDDGNGGYIDIEIKDIEGKNVYINSISITYSKFTKATPTVLVNENTVTGVTFEPTNTDLYGYTYEVNGNSVRIQNQYNEKIDYWSILALYEITVNYTIK